MFADERNWDEHLFSLLQQAPGRWERAGSAPPQCMQGAPSADTTLAQNKPTALLLGLFPLELTVF